MHLDVSKKKIANQIGNQPTFDISVNIDRMAVVYQKTNSVMINKVHINLHLPSCNMFITKCTCSIW